MTYLEKKINKGNLIIVSGDFNIMPDDIDSYAPEKYINDALFRVEIRKKYRQIINLGFNDVFRVFNKKEGNYTFWDYMSGSWQKNNGLRIDHFLVTNNLIDKVKKVEIVKKIRAQIKPSDHVPVECTFIQFCHKYLHNEQYPLRQDYLQTKFQSLPNLLFVCLPIYV